MKQLLPAILSLSLLILPGRGGQAPATEGIRLPLQALTLAMVENDLAYDAESDEFVWTALYYTLSLYGQTDLRARYDGDAWVVPSECAEDFFHALFASRTQLPPIPPALADRVAYDAERDEYRVAVGDCALSELTLATPRPVAPGTWLAEGSLIRPDDDGVICRFTVTLAPRDNMFGCSVADLVMR